MSDIFIFFPVKKNFYRVYNNKVIRSIEFIGPDFIGYKLWNGDGFKFAIKILDYFT